MHFRMTGDNLIRWTIWLATLAYFGRWVCELWPGDLASSTRFRAARACWTAAFGLLVVHVVCAFQFYHHWSHADAVQHSIRQTESTVGFRFGGGPWVNYVLMAFWLVDLLWWWLRPNSFAQRPRWLHLTWNILLAFIAFNGTVVFASGFIRWMTLAGVALLCALGSILQRPRESNAVKDF